MNFKISVVKILVVLGLSGCTASLYMPTENDANSFNTTLDTLIMSRKIYVKTCSSCHNLFLPAKFTHQEWLGILDKMQERAKLDNSQKTLIDKYLQINCKK